MDKDIRNKIKEILDKPVKNRTENEHQFLIKWEYAGSVREYLLSMGEFIET